MPRLVEFQRSLVTDILVGSLVSEKHLRRGRVPADVAIGVHRNTVLAALVNAIRLRCPTLRSLVDANFFEQAVRDYARSRPPYSACLSKFGDGFACFLETYPPARGFPFFADVVRFDIAIDEAAHGRSGVYHPSISLGLGTTFRMLASLSQISTRYPVDMIRDEVEAGRFEGLEGMDMTSRPHHFALWPSRSGASVKRLTEPAAAFLRALLAGGDAEVGMDKALERSELGEVVSAVQREILIPPLAIVSFDGRSGVAP